jgi:hypothetical protein
MHETTVIRIEREGSETKKVKCKLQSWPRDWSPTDKSKKESETEQSKGVATPPLFDLDSISDVPTAANVVQRLGETIYSELCKDESIKSIIEHLLLANAQTTRPIYIDTGTVLAETVSWEALYNIDHGFLALDRRWPIARLADSDRYPTPFRHFVFKPPLRILAIISAAGYPGEREWQALCDAAKIAEENDLPVEIRVLTGEVELYNSITSAPPKGVSVEKIPRTDAALDTLIGTFKPHLLHFFCHGIIDAGGAWLQIRTAYTDRPLEIHIGDLGNLPSLQKVWLIVLNCCVSGAPAGDAPSMAYQLVTKVGVPVVVGTIERVELTDAVEFTDAFYQRILYAIATAYNAALPQQQIEFLWTDALFAARKALEQKYQKKPAESKQWLLPVMYERRDSLTVIKDWSEEPVSRAQPEKRIDETTAADQAEKKAFRANMAVDLLRNLPPGTPDGIKKALLDAILADSTPP